MIAPDSQVDVIDAIADVEADAVVSESGVNETSNIAITQFSQVIASVMNEAQFAILRGRTPTRYIKKRPGKGGKTFSYVPHGYVTAVLNRTFGFDWDWEILPQQNGQMFLHLPEVTVPNYDDTKTLKMRPASVIVHGKLTVRVRNPADLTQVVATITKTSSGEKEVIRGMTWGGLIKSAESDAFKKCASRLGIALDLYWQDADEDYLSDTDVTPAQNDDVQAAAHVDAMRTQGQSDATIVEKLKAEGKSYKVIAGAMGLKVGEVVRLRTVIKG